MISNAKSLTLLSAWNALATHQSEIRKLHLRELFAGDPERGWLWLPGLVCWVRAPRFSARKMEWQPQ